VKSVNFAHAAPFVAPPRADAVKWSPMAEPLQTTIAKAREAMRQKMQELPAQPPSRVATTPAPKRAPKVATAKPAPAPQTVPEPVPSAAKPVPRETVATQPAPTQPTPTQPAEVRPAEAPPQAEVQAPVATELPERSEAESAARKQASKKQKTRKPSPTAPVFQPLGGPPLPISAEKQQRLANLLEQYRADQITPEQYHQQRAKILAEP